MISTLNIDKTVARLLALDEEGITNREIAEVLNLEGYRSLIGREFTLPIVAKILSTIRADVPSRYSVAARRLKAVS